jgi:hypothetical protein
VTDRVQPGHAEVGAQRVEVGGGAPGVEGGELAFQRDGALLARGLGGLEPDLDVQPRRVGFDHLAADLLGEAVGGGRVAGSAPVHADELELLEELLREGGGEPGGVDRAGGPVDVVDDRDRDGAVACPEQLDAGGATARRVRGVEDPVHPSAVDFQPTRELRR